MLTLYVCILSVCFRVDGYILLYIKLTCSEFKLLNLLNRILDESHNYETISPKIILTPQLKRPFDQPLHTNMDDGNNDFIHITVMLA